MHNGRVCLSVNSLVPEEDGRRIFRYRHRKAKEVMGRFRMTIDPIPWLS